MKKKNIKKIQWDEKALKNFEGFLKQMYGEYGIVKSKQNNFGEFWNTEFVEYVQCYFIFLIYK